MAETRLTLLGNRLVLIGHGPQTGPAPGDLSPETDLVAMLGEDGRLALALTDAVPAGLYAKAALESLGLWSALSGRVVEADNVRAALALVASAATAEPRVHVTAIVPEESHPPIRYPVAVLRAARAPEVAADFLDWLQAPRAQAIFAAHGFATAPR